MGPHYVGPTFSFDTTIIWPPHRIHIERLLGWFITLIGSAGVFAPRPESSSQGAPWIGLKGAASEANKFYVLARCASPLVAYLIINFESKKIKFSEIAQTKSENISNNHSKIYSGQVARDPQVGK